MVTCQTLDSVTLADKSDLQLPRRRSSRHLSPVKHRFFLPCLAALACFALPATNKAEENPDKPLIERALADFEKKKYAEALAKLQEAEKEDPNNPFIMNLMGAAYTKQQDYTTAKTYFDKALSQNPDFFPARFNLGEILFLQKQYPQALGFFTDMLRQAPSNELLQFKVVLSLLMTDQVEDARKLASRMRLPGEGPAWYYAHAAIETKVKNKGKASEYLSGAKTLFPNQISLYDETFEDLGWPTK
jgi:tetratricopeptide (TPR) repeat protein